MTWSAYLAFSSGTERSKLDGQEETVTASVLIQPVSYNKSFHAFSRDCLVFKWSQVKRGPCFVPRVRDASSRPRW